MNAKQIFKTVFLLVVLLLLVLMGMNNGGKVDFKLPPLLVKPVKLEAALMYFGFFAVGFLTGTVLNAGGKKGGSSKPPKSDK